MTITGTYYNFSGGISIPSSINGYTVTSIGSQAFKNQTDLTSIILPSSITTIGNRAFQYCNNLASVYMSTTAVTRIEYNTFDSCKLTNIGFPDNLTYIGNYAFTGSNTIKALPSSLVSIGSYAFKNNLSNNLVISSSITNIGYRAFYMCNSLTLYTEYNSRPSEWNTSWNYSNRPVVWGCSLSSSKSYIISFTKTSSNPSNPNATNGITKPYRSGYSFGGWYTASDYSGTQYMDVTAAPNGTLYAKWNKSSCVAEGTLVTLADGSQVAVEDLTGDENLLVWNLETGSFDIALMLFIDSDPYTEYEIIHAYFSDGTEVKVIDEHAFWDIDLNKYVFFRNDADKYIGHWFNKQSEDINGNMTWTEVQLIDVEIYDEYTTAWSPVTYSHLCFYVNGMLSMPGATEGLINIFNVNADTMKIDEDAFQDDIEKYGLFTYEEFSQIHYIPEVVFDAFNVQYFKISMGKGLLDWETIEFLIERYLTFFDMEETDANSNPSSDTGNLNNNCNCNHGTHGNGNHCGHHNHNGRHSNKHRNGCGRRNGYYYKR